MNEKAFQYRISNARGGRVVFVCHSAYRHKSREEALYFAHRECVRRGFNPFDCAITTPLGVLEAA